jgi:hypothetical protein
MNAAGREEGEAMANARAYAELYAECVAHRFAKPRRSNFDAGWRAHAGFINGHAYLAARTDDATEKP